MGLAHSSSTMHIFEQCRSGAIIQKIDGKSYAETERLKKGLDAKEFFMAFYNADIDKIAVENPVPSAVYKLPKYTQIIEPYFSETSTTKRRVCGLKVCRR